MDSPWWVYAIGFSAQILFFFRVVIQWWQSEKTHKVVSPPSFWILSIMASMILFLYGWLRHDISIFAGELLIYYIYMWNIWAQGVYKRLPRIVPILQAAFPVVVVCALLQDVPRFVATFRPNDELPLDLMLFGLAGQVVYKSRFIYQLIYGIRRKESSLPLMFWILAVTGALMIIVYGLIRHDWVLVIGQFGIFASIRNIWIALSERGRRTAGAREVVATGDARDSGTARASISPDSKAPVDSGDLLTD